MKKIIKDAIKGNGEIVATNETGKFNNQDNYK